MKNMVEKEFKNKIQNLFKMYVKVKIKKLKKEFLMNTIKVSNTKDQKLANLKSLDFFKLFQKFLLKSP